MRNFKIAFPLPKRFTAIKTMIIARAILHKFLMKVSTSPLTSVLKIASEMAELLISVVS
ncbi:hypothetical protein D3C85_1905850 [compost metagenome]